MPQQQLQQQEQEQQAAEWQRQHIKLTTYFFIFMAFIITEMFVW